MCSRSEEGLCRGPATHPSFYGQSVIRISFYIERRCENQIVFAFACNRLFDRAVDNRSKFEFSTDYKLYQGKVPTAEVESSHSRIYSTKSRVKLTLKSTFEEKSGTRL